MPDKKYSVSWKRPIHLEHPELQTDSSFMDLPEAKSREEAEAVVKRWGAWFRANKCFNIRLIETVPEQKSEFPVDLDP